MLLAPIRAPPAELVPPTNWAVTSSEFIAMFQDLKYHYCASSFRGRIMTDQEMIDAALQAIGVGAKGDYKIQQTVHATELASKAPTLAAILNSWMHARASAELIRKQYFEAVTGADAGAAVSHPPALLLQFEYFRRYHFDSRVAYYGQRSGDHRRSAARVLQATGWSVALASISLGLAGFLGGIDPRWSSAAALGTVATAIAAFASTNGSVYQYRRNSRSEEHTSELQSR